jgi:hypothetical protein
MFIDSVSYFIYKIRCLSYIKDKTLHEKIDMYIARDKGIPFCLYDEYVTWRAKKIKEESNAE